MWKRDFHRCDILIETSLLFNKNGLFNVFSSRLGNYERMNEMGLKTHSNCPFIVKTTTNVWEAFLSTFNVTQLFMTSNVLNAASFKATCVCVERKQLSLSLSLPWLVLFLFNGSFTLCYWGVPTATSTRHSLSSVEPVARPLKISLYKFFEKFLSSQTRRK